MVRPSCLLGHDFEFLVEAAIAERNGSGSEALAFRRRDLVAYPLADHLALELGKGEQHIEGEPAHAGSRVERLGDRHERNPVLIEQFDQLGEIGERAGKAINLIDHHDGDLAGPDISQEGIVTPLGACGPAGGPVAKGMKKISYRGYRFPPEIIQQAIWLYLRFTLSLRDVEDLLAERGIMVSYETVRRWVNHFGPLIAADLRKRRPKPHTTWHLDEVYLKIAGRMVYLWRAVDAEGEVLDVLVQSRRNKRAALNLMRKLLKKYGFVPDKLVTDDLRSYAAAASDLGIARRHESGQWRNNRAENSHQPT